MTTAVQVRNKVVWMTQEADLDTLSPPMRTVSTGTPSSH